MKFNISMILLSVSVLSCAQETPKVKQVSKMKPKTDLKGVKVVNADDPICQMKTAEFLKDTIVYKGKTYGFCSDHCKKEFRKSPAKYALK
ncbi:YHS domain-containing protein [Epilithonimonas pallida]|uniref:YHS domain-containing protein n=1 Tax=Epilithonimonas pallida TaxID=373671 RepID=A0ABY1R713_9FLAO|nr:YHS domain-containing protein [Epilithonimonas pallida]SMP96934.1 YHS domain-containing protein [Epilithonimonas pallida]